jgi:nucleotide-binding universal stress UspA family protein
VIQSIGAIVVGVDGSGHAREAVRWAADEARARQAVLLVLHVAPSAPKGVPGWLPEGATADEAARAVVDDAVAMAAISCPDVVVRGEVRFGAPVQELIDAGASADLLVVGARGSGGFLGLLVGSVGERCIQRARGPVVVVRHGLGDPGAQNSGGRIVVGVDGSADAERALRWALGEARARGVAVEAVCAWQYPPTHAVVATSALRFESAALDVERQARQVAAGCAPEVPVTVSVVYEAIVPALLERARTAALLVVGPHGQGGYRDLFLGSVAHQCAHHAPCPVVVVRKASEPDQIPAGTGDGWTERVRGGGRRGS